jgi:N6-L-threonylcarbamoyladenine synthase
LVERVIDVDDVRGSNPLPPTKNIMRILAIETSCDETALAIIDGTGDLTSPSFKVIGTALYSQIETHKQYGGVFPAVAKREHAKKLVPLLDSLFKKSPISFSENNKRLTDSEKEILKNLLSREIELYETLINFIETSKKPDIDMIAVTMGPGLEPALWVGINFAKALSLIWNIPVMPTNHMEGHIVSVLKQVEDLDKNKIDVLFPGIALLISGGHTEIVLIKNWGEYEILGATKDDAVGEAFDKTARLLGLPYPGGPEISKLADKIRQNIIKPTQKNAAEIDAENIEIKLPRPMINSGDFNFSFSGLKTAVLYLIKKLESEKKLTEEVKSRIAFEFENAAIEVLLSKTRKAIHDYGAKTLIIGGGVTANKYVRETFSKLANNDLNVFVPERELSTDNAVMIAIASFLKSFAVKPEINPEIKASGNLKL